MLSYQEVLRAYMQENYPEAYLKGIQCFNVGQYFECHELLESLWLETGGVQEIFYQALIQAAVAIYHLEGNNLWGALSLYEAALDKFSKIPNTYMGLSVRGFERNLKKFFQPYLSLKKGDPIHIEPACIPKIQLDQES
jgi:predicted metal-dependent hydrolase